MKKMVGTILTAMALVALVPVTASAARPLPPQGSGSGTGASNGGSRSAKCSAWAALTGNCKTRQLPPLVGGGKHQLPPVTR
jgi:hypothetical protein